MSIPGSESAALQAPKRSEAACSTDNRRVPTGGDAVRHGVRWLGLSLAFSRGLRLATMAVLTRILMKTDFGTMALVNGAVLALSAFREIGFSQALIHRHCKTDEDLRLTADTVFWLLLAANVAVAVLGYAVAPWLAGFFSDGFVDLVPVLRAMLLLYVIEGLMVTPAALLQKNMEFRGVSLLEMQSTLTYAIVTIGCALMGLGVWSLVFGQLGSRALQAVGLFRCASFWPRLRLDYSIARELFNYGRWLWASASLQAIGRSADRLILGNVAGGAALGVYGMAFSLCNAPAKPVGNIINRVAFPAMAKLKGDQAQIAKTMRASFGLVAFLAVPAAAGLAAVSEDFVSCVYTKAWVEMADIVSILAFHASAMAIGTIARPVLLACGKPRVVFNISVGRQVALLMVFGGVYMAYSLPPSAEDVAALRSLREWASTHEPSILISWAVLIPGLCAGVLGLVCAARACAGSVLGFLYEFSRIAACTGVMIVAVNAMQSLVSSEPRWARLFLAVAVGIGAYWGSSRLINPRGLRDFIAQLRALAPGLQRD